MFYDRREVLQNADPETVARSLGIPMENRGRYTYLLCPGHERNFGKTDHSFGNAILTNHGYHCFACNRSGSVFDMVMEMKNVSFHEAIDYVAKTTGCDYDQPDKLPPRQPLDRRECELLGLSYKDHTFCIVNEKFREKNDINVVPKREQHRFSMEEQCDLVTSNERFDTLYDLQKNDPVFFKELLIEKAKEAIEKREKMIEHVSDIEFYPEKKLYYRLDKDQLMKIYIDEIAEIKKIIYKIAMSMCEQQKVATA